MKKTILLILINLVCLFGISAMALAYNSDLGRGMFEDSVGKLPLQKDVTVSAGNVITVILSVVGVMFMILTIVAGVMWMTAAGDDGKIATAKKIIVAATAGLAIIMFAYTISYFINSRLSKGSPDPVDTSRGCCRYDSDFFQEESKTACDARSNKVSWVAGACPSN